MNEKFQSLCLFVNKYQTAPTFVSLSWLLFCGSCKYCEVVPVRFTSVWTVLMLQEKQTYYKLPCTLSHCICMGIFTWCLLWHRSFVTIELMSAILRPNFCDIGVKHSFVKNSILWCLCNRCWTCGDFVLCIIFLCIVSILPKCLFILITLLWIPQAAGDFSLVMTHCKVCDEWGHNAWVVFL